MINRRTLIAIAIGIALSAPVQAREPTIEQLAKQVTVRVLSESGSGSGVIVDRHNTTYVILTNQHVAPEAIAYTVLTSDGDRHPATLRKIALSNSLDLALIEFESQQDYQTVKVGRSETLKTGDLLYSAGFPNYHFPRDRSYLESTYNWDMKAFLLTSGTLQMQAPKPLLQGYSLGYTNTVRDGMSGGPILDRHGYLVGINGRLSYPVQGDRAFLFEDGTQPSKSLIQQMKPLSWGIPASQFQSLFANAH